jgi:hypothetical protein
LVGDIGLMSTGNCSPRLPASRLQVKKQGPNTGRWFYTCQEPKETRCAFFLWETDAKYRERSMVLSNKISEPHSRQPPVRSNPKKTIGGYSATSNRSKQIPAHQDEEEFGDWPLSFEDDMKLVQSIEADPETPRKVIKTNEFMTPSTKRKKDEDTLPTPVTGPRFKSNQRKKSVSSDEDVFYTPPTESRGSMGDSRERFILRSPSSTPTPCPTSGFPESNIEIEAQKGQEYDISDEVIDLLKDENIDEQTLTNLKQLLNRHALRISGIAKGRDITRVALKAKDMKIAELKQKIDELEKRGMNKSISPSLMEDMEGYNNSWDSSEWE